MASDLGDSSNPARAAKLKDEGNACFSRMLYGEAYEKYTQAIELDGQNAVLFANRAAASMGMMKQELLSEVCSSAC